MHNGICMYADAYMKSNTQCNLTTHTQACVIHCRYSYQICVCFNKETQQTLPTNCFSCMLTLFFHTILKKHKMSRVWATGNLLTNPGLWWQICARLQRKILATSYLVWRVTMPLAAWASNEAELNRMTCGGKYSPQHLILHHTNPKRWRSMFMLWTIKQLSKSYNLLQALSFCHICREALSVWETVTG